MEQSQTQKIQSALTQAYAWVKSRRKQYPDADDVWSLRRDWMTTEPQLAQTLAAGQYQFSQTAMMTTKAGTRVTVASASDACVPAQGEIIYITQSKSAISLFEVLPQPKYKFFDNQATFEPRKTDLTNKI